VSQQTLTRPILLPGLRPLWRSPHAVQLGTDPGQAMVLEFPHPAAAQLLDLLDGSRTEQAIIAEMSRLGMPFDDARKLLGDLVEAGLVVGAHTLMPPALPPELRDRIATEAAALALRFRERPATPAAILRRRYDARVIVAGEGTLAGLMITTLGEAGVGHVATITEPGGPAISVVCARRTLTTPEHPGAPQPARTEPTSARRILTTFDDSGGPQPARTEPAASFVVQIGWMARAPQRCARGVPHLTVGVRDGVAIVGPLVPADGGPCLRCLDFHRTDRDPAWPRLAAQLIRSPAPCAAATLRTAAGFAVAEVLAFLDGGNPTTIGTTVEINGVAPWRRRVWTTHPRCACTKHDDNPR